MNIPEIHDQVLPSTRQHFAIGAKFYRANPIVIRMEDVNRLTSLAIPKVNCMIATTAR